MKKLLALTGLILVISMTASFAQTNTAPPLIDKAGEKAVVDEAKVLLSATNGVAWDVAPYVTVFPSGKSRGVGTFGGGIYIQREVANQQYFAIGAGLDYMSGGKKHGQLTMPSGSVTLKYPIDVGVHIGLGANTLVWNPLVFAGAALPLSGAGNDNLNVAGIAGAGGFIPIPHKVKIFGKTTTVSVGYMYAKWMNAGDYSGGHHEFFVNGSF